MWLMRMRPSTSFYKNNYDMYDMLRLDFFVLNHFMHFMALQNLGNVAEFGKRKKKQKSILTFHERKSD